VSSADRPVQPAGPEALSPTYEQLGLLLNYPEGTPFAMVNLLKFNRPDGAARYWGEYVPGVGEPVRAAGGKEVWKGRVEHLLIGAAPPDWDAVWLVGWPSKQAFLAMMNHPDFAATQDIRASSLQAMAFLLASELRPA